MPRQPFRESVRSLVRRVTAPKPKRVKLGGGFSTIRNETADVEELKKSLEKHPLVDRAEIEVSAIPYLHVHLRNSVSRAKILEAARKGGLEFRDSQAPGRAWLVVEHKGDDTWSISHSVSGDSAQQVTINHDNANRPDLTRAAKRRILTHFEHLLGKVIDV